jgi:hypothetical protein
MNIVEVQDGRTRKSVKKQTEVLNDDDENDGKPLLDPNM